MPESNRYLISKTRNDVAIQLVDRAGNFKALAWIDLEDLEKVKPWRWYLSSHGYATTNIAGHTVKLHQLIMNRLAAGDGLEVDHKDRIRLNCRKNNLRIVTRSINMKNVALRKNNSSGVSGVYWNKRDQRWCAQIKDKEGKRLHLGLFKDKQDALNARVEAEQEYRYL